MDTGASDYFISKIMCKKFPAEQIIDTWQVDEGQIQLANNSNIHILRIDTDDLRRICQNSCVSPTNARILIYCTSNERQYLYLSVDVFNS